VGNPHLVCFVADPDLVPVASHGPRIELDSRFPHRTNVEFIAVTGPDALTMRVWERGVGETLSCGTGVCASAAVAHRRGLVGEHVTVRVRGGTHEVDLAETIRLHGPVTHVFDTEVSVA
jgi:diaminopimelate epimerase